MNPKQPNRSLTAQQHPARAVWVALREDGLPGTGAVGDPFDGSSPEKLNALFDRFHAEYGPNLIIQFGPGIFYGNRAWQIHDNWQVRGSGMDITIFKTHPDRTSRATVGFFARVPPRHPWVGGFQLSDCTFDFNVLELQTANRAFVYFSQDQQAVLYYGRVDEPPAPWQSVRNYRRGSTVTHQGREYVATAHSEGIQPAQNMFWSILRPNDPGALPAWEPAASYDIGDAVVHAGVPFLCIASGMTPPPDHAADRWMPADPEAPDPFLSPSAADVWSGYGGGGNIARRVKIINGYGSSFYGREAFLIKLGGDDCRIEDCYVDLFRGDYATVLVVFGGHNNVIRGCTVRGDSGNMLFAYGGWENYDTVFENNFAYGVRVVTNIDSLHSKNVIFRNNVFMNCREAGLGINVGGGPGGSSMDGLFIHDNLIEMQDNARLSAIQLGSDGLRNVRIWNNVLRTVSGTGRVTSVTIAGNTQNITLTGNTGEPNMTAKLPMHAFAYDNYDLQGRPLQGFPVRQVRVGESPGRLDALSPAEAPLAPEPAVEPLEAALGPEGDIRDWLVLGPFPHPPEAQPEGITLGAGYAFDFLSAIGGETGLRPRTGESVLIRFPVGADASMFWEAERFTPRRRAWQRVQADPRHFVNALDLPDVAVSSDSVCLYAHVLLRSPDTRAAVLHLGSDDGFVLFFNDERIAEVRNDRRGYRRDQDAVPLQLLAGDNALLLKVANYWGGFGWGARLTTPAGVPLTDVRVVLP